MMLITTVLRTPTVHTQLVISVETARLCVLYALSLEMTPFDRSYVILQRDGQTDRETVRGYLLHGLKQS